jgi:hypothetical protein
VNEPLGLFRSDFSRELVSLDRLLEINTQARAPNARSRRAISSRHWARLQRHVGIRHRYIKLRRPQQQPSHRPGGILGPPAIR